MIKMMDTITIKKDIFEELVKKKEEFDAIIESIELMSNPEVQKSIKRSREDIKVGRIHKLKDLL